MDDQSREMKRGAFLPLYVTNFFGTLNDDFLKTFAGFTVIGWIQDERGKSVVMGMTAAALVLPYAFCSPLTDRLTAVWKKCRIVRPGPVAFGVILCMLAFDLGLFKLPFDTEIQKTVKGPRLNTVLSYFNQVSFLFMLAASGCYALVSWAFGSRAFLLLLAAVFLLVPFLFMLGDRKVLACTGRWILRCRYKVEADGIEALKDAGKACLVLSDKPISSAGSPREVESEVSRS